MLSWNDLNGEVAIKDTTKKFYNQYLHKIVVYCPGARSVYDKKSHTDMPGVIADRKKRVAYLKNFNRYIVDYLHESDIYQLEELVKLAQSAKATGIKIRIEEPYATIYSNDESQLYQIARTLDQKRLTEVHVPASPEAVEILNRGEIVTKGEALFPYKVMLKECPNLSQETRAALLDHLYNLGDDQVCLTKSLVRHLGSSSNFWFPGGYFYAKDTQVVTFVCLISPGIVSGIFKLSKLDQ